MTSSSRSHRTFVRLPQSLAVDFDVAVTRNGVTAAELCYMWVIEATRTVEAGRGARLPKQQRAPKGAMIGAKGVGWTQGSDEYEYCRERIESVGSSIAACIRAAAQAYVESDGNVVVMAWPPKRLYAAAA